MLGKIGLTTNGAWESAATNEALTFSTLPEMRCSKRVCSSSCGCMFPRRYSVRLSHALSLSRSALLTCTAETSTPSPRPVEVQSTAKRAKHASFLVFSNVCNGELHFRTRCAGVGTSHVKSPAPFHRPIL
eukprot:468723-Rhodomonas_salina.2